MESARLKKVSTTKKKVNRVLLPLCLESIFQTTAGGDGDATRTQSKRKVARDECATLLLYKVSFK